MLSEAGRGADIGAKEFMGRGSTQLTRGNWSKHKGGGNPAAATSKENCITKNNEDIMRGGPKIGETSARLHNSGVEKNPIKEGRPVNSRNEDGEWPTKMTSRKYSGQRSSERVHSGKKKKKKKTYDDCLCVIRSNWNGKEWKKGRTKAKCRKT